MTSRIEKMLEANRAAEKYGIEDLSERLYELLGYNFAEGHLVGQNSEMMAQLPSAQERWEILKGSKREIEVWAKNKPKYEKQVGHIMTDLICCLNLDSEIAAYILYAKMAFNRDAYTCMLSELLPGNKIDEKAKQKCLAYNRACI